MAENKNIVLDLVFLPPVRPGEGSRSACELPLPPRQAPPPYLFSPPCGEASTKRGDFLVTPAGRLEERQAQREATGTPSIFRYSEFRDAEPSLASGNECPGDCAGNEDFKKPRP
jgi:hypothetical protein